MTDEPRRTRGVQRGPRSTHVIESVRAAALTELDRVGFARLAMDAVARTAGVSRTTVYRRWPTKTALLATVVEPVLQRYDTDPDTGTARGDLIAALALIRANSALPEGRALIAAAGEPDSQAVVRAANDRTIAMLERLLTRAVDRGEITTDVRTVAYLAMQGTVMWPQIRDTPLDDAELERFARVLLP
ncbi:TetR/AcrR family transcriptional regulator [Actinoplanes couchii]|uniref:TetR family transcriptional regulator n=1 Tax=Actinoplanes couchii TaxID=403638 RepID=A0ABQ3XKE4_9ACTN|nr:TetR/AcrR family transcriptional regulator [Actinoplanes couchii]MDR6320507.1 AcrR family transcriptional regulator [Actinoplanes couchii]GID58912.1 TetR family transcriptional regulator [Actinoplanes couchii]